MSAEQLAQLVGRAKAVIDNGLCRVGPRLDRSDAQAAALTGAASRALALSDAVVGLCRRDHPAEALPLVRHLAETVVDLRWAAADTARAAEASAAPRAEGWDVLVDDARLAARARAAGVPDEDVAAVRALAATFAAASRSGAPWSHVFDVNQRPAPDAERVLSLTVRLMGHALAGLERRWPGTFPGAEELCSS